MMARMELADRVAVVTGGASGIGRALAWRLVEEGARGVVVADLDADGARAVAADIGVKALAVACDVAIESHVAETISRAQDAFGPVDLFCANAGVAIGTHLSTPDDVRLATGVVASTGAMLEPEEVADAVVEGLRAERFLILPHPEVLTFFRRKADDYDRWLAGMRRLQARV